MTAENRNLDRLLRPHSIAIAGVSPEPGSVGAAVLSNLDRFGFKGDIHLVSRTRSEISGRRCLATIDELPAGVDVAVLALPAAALRDAVAACVKRRVGAGIIFAAGFAETGETGLSEQQMITQMARDGGMALNGPNCIGLTNFSDHIPLTYEPLTPLPSGQESAIGVVAQSGAMLSALRVALVAKGLSLSLIVSTGNEADLGAEDFLEYLVEDGRTRTIVMFAEQIREPQRFLAAAKHARRQAKAIVLMHTGRSTRAREAARTHTGALAGNYDVMATLVEHHAVVLVETIEELIDTAELLVRFRRPPLMGAGLITNSGAFKGFALDFCDRIGLELPKPQPETLASLAKALPPFATIDNPLDTTGQTIKEPWIFRECAAQLLSDAGIGSLAVAIVPGAPEQAMAKVDALLPPLSASDKPVAVAAMVDEGPVPPEFVSTFRDNGVAVFRSPERMLRALAHATRYGRRLNETVGAPNDVAMSLIQLPRTGVLAEYEGKAVLVRLGIPVPRGALARSLSEAQEIGASIGFPIVLKAQAAALPHKSDVGGVIVGLADSPSLAEGWERLHHNIRTARPDLVLDGVLVETVAPQGLEMVVGGRRDSDWGPVLMIGLGGIWIEALKDVRLIAADLSRSAIADEVRRLKGVSLLTGARGKSPADIAALAEAIYRVGALMRAHPNITEIDINPLVVYPKGVLALDAVIVTSGVEDRT